MKSKPTTPKTSYGVMLKLITTNHISQVIEQVRHLGYGIISAGYNVQTISKIRKDFDCLHKNYVKSFGKVQLSACNELSTIRWSLLFSNPAFLQLVMNKHLSSCIEKLIIGQSKLTQQNGIINPPRETYNQRCWLRDMPYQHFVASSPIAINSLYFVDDFTSKNGATFVLPSSHKADAFPSEAFVSKNAIQI